MHRLHPRLQKMLKQEQKQVTASAGSKGEVLEEPKIKPLSFKPLTFKR